MTDEIYSQIDNFYSECLDMATCANTKAEIYRIFSISSSIIILLASASSAIMSRFNSEIITNLITVMSGIIVSVQIFLSVYNPERKAGLVKKISQTLKRISRDIRQLKSITSDRKSEIQSKLDNFHNEVDDLDLTMFNINLSSSAASFKENGNGTGGMKRVPAIVSI